MSNVWWLLLWNIHSPLICYFFPLLSFRATLFLVFCGWSIRIELLIHNSEKSSIDSLLWAAPFLWLALGLDFCLSFVHEATESELRIWWTDKKFFSPKQLWCSFLGTCFLLDYNIYFNIVNIWCFKYFIRHSWLF